MMVFGFTQILIKLGAIWNYSLYHSFFVFSSTNTIRKAMYRYINRQINPFKPVLCLGWLKVLKVICTWGLFLPSFAPVSFFPLYAFNLAADVVSGNWAVYKLNKQPQGETILREVNPSFSSINYFLFIYCSLMESDPLQ